MKNITDRLRTEYHNIEDEAFNGIGDYFTPIKIIDATLIIPIMDVVEDGVWLEVKRMLVKIFNK